MMRKMKAEAGTAQRASTAAAEKREQDEEATVGHGIKQKLVAPHGSYGGDGDLTI